MLSLDHFWTTAQAHEGPRSVCTCGHSGDHGIARPGSSEHEGMVGHAACKVESCICGKFEFARFTQEFQEKLNGGKK